jgi:hypothetical protein
MKYNQINQLGKINFAIRISSPHVSKGVIGRVTTGTHASRVPDARPKIAVASTLFQFFSSCSSLKKHFQWLRVSYPFFQLV